MATKPATSLFNAIDKTLKRKWEPEIEWSEHRLISERTLRRWRAWAKSVDARMRLDGSKRNRRKK